MSTEINDVKLEYSPEKCFYDINFNGVDLDPATNLITAVNIALFTDGRSRNDDVIPNSRGWAGDTLNETEEPGIGSRLWLLTQRKITQQLLNDMQEYATEALQQFIDSGIAKSISVEALVLDNINGLIELRVEIVNPDNELQQFKYVWDQLKQRFRGGV